MIILEKHMLSAIPIGMMGDKIRSIPLLGLCQVTDHMVVH